MKKITLLFLSVICSLTMFAQTTFYLNTGGSGLWGIDDVNYTFAYSTSSSSSDEVHTIMTPVGGVDNLYAATVSCDVDDMNYIYYSIQPSGEANPSMSTMTYYSDYFYASYSEIKGNLYTVTAVYSGGAGPISKTIGNWSTYESSTGDGSGDATGGSTETESYTFYIDLGGVAFWGTVCSQLYITTDLLDMDNSYTTMTLVGGETSIYSATVSYNSDFYFVNFDLFDFTSILETPTGNLFTITAAGNGGNPNFAAGTWSTYGVSSGDAGDAGDGTTLYLNTGGSDLWGSTTLQYAFCYLDAEKVSHVEYMDLVSGEENIYAVTTSAVISEISSVYFERHSSGVYEDQVSFPLTIPTDGNNMFIITKYDVAGFVTDIGGEWGKYEPSTGGSTDTDDGDGTGDDVVSGTTFYLNTGGLNFWGSGAYEYTIVYKTSDANMTDIWVVMDLVDEEIDVYTATIPVALTDLYSVYFSCHNTGTTGHSYNTEEYYTDYMYSFTSNCFTITYSGSGTYEDMANGTWSSYGESTGDGGSTEPGSYTFYLNTGDETLWGSSTSFYIVVGYTDSYPMELVAGETNIYSATINVNKGFMFYNRITFDMVPIDDEAAGDLYTITQLAAGANYTSGEWSTYGESTGGGGTTTDPDPSTTMYLNLNGQWSNSNGEQFAAKYYVSGSYMQCWTAFMTLVPGTDDVYEFSIEGEITEIQFYAFDSSITTPGYSYISNTNNINSSDITGNCYTFNSESAGTWGEFTPPTSVTRTLYLNTGGADLWGTDGANFAVYYMETGQKNGVYSDFMTLVADEENTYSVTLEMPIAINYIYFIRCAAGNNDKYQFDTNTANLTLGSDNLYTILTCTNINDYYGGSTTGEWSTYGESTGDGDAEGMTLYFNPGDESLLWATDDMQYFILHVNTDYEDGFTLMTLATNETYIYTATIPVNEEDLCYIAFVACSLGVTNPDNSDILKCSEYQTPTFGGDLFTMTTLGDNFMTYDNGIWSTYGESTGGDGPTVDVDVNVVNAFDVIGNNGRLYINGEGDAQLMVYSITGQVVVNTSFNSNFNCQLQKGIYIIQLNGVAQKVSLY
ncbi:MAG: T9SS type A sorting domain-containing protein [bacterium]